MRIGQPGVLRYLAEHVLPVDQGGPSVACAERDTDWVQVELLKRIREERIEPPADGRAGRMVASALRTAEQNWFTAILTRLDAAAMDRVLALAGWGEDALRHTFGYRLSETSGHNRAELERCLGHANDGDLCARCCDRPRREAPEYGKTC
jgi:hypothetical protein